MKAPSPTHDEMNQGHALHRPNFSHEQEGYKKALSSRQMQMIAIGGAIGTGLFLGTGGRLAQGGPMIVVVYAVCGFFAFVVMRALGELVLHRPSSGSFVSYAREFYGEKLAFAAGWMSTLHSMLLVVVGSTAAAVYLKHWSIFEGVPQWILALSALTLVMALNLVSVKVFGELEFWFSLIKVTAIIAFLVVGIVVLIGGWPSDLGPTGITMLTEHGGLLPNGASSIAFSIVLVGGVVFAYAGVEHIGNAAGEAENPEKVIPRAINSIIIRISIFYVGSVLLLSLLLPASAYSSSESPFVTFFRHFGDPATAVVVAGIMNLIVLTADLSGLNASLYAAGRILHSLAQSGAAPGFAAKISKRGVPYGGLMLTGIAGVAGVFLNVIVPKQAFEIAISTAALGTICGWATIILCQMRLRRWAQEGKLVRPQFKLFGAPFTSWLTLGFLATVIVLIALNYPTGTWTVSSLVVIVPLLVLMWFGRRPKMLAIARGRQNGIFADADLTSPAVGTSAPGTKESGHKQDI